MGFFGLTWSWTASLNNPLGNTEGSRENGAKLRESSEKFLFDRIPIPCIKAQSLVLDTKSTKSVSGNGKGTQLGSFALLDIFETRVCLLQPD